MAEKPVWHVLAIVDASPALLLPSLFALHARADAVGGRLRIVALASHTHHSATTRMASLLINRGVSFSMRLAVSGFQSNLRAQLRTILTELSHTPSTEYVIDISAASSGATAMAQSLMEQSDLPTALSWFDDELNSSVLMRRDGALQQQAIDVGGLANPIAPDVLLQLIGLERRDEEPYGRPASDREALEGIATDVLALSQSKKAYGRFRQQLRPAGTSKERLTERILRLGDLPAGWPSVLEKLQKIGLARTDATGDYIIRGPDDRAGVFLLSGGWLELVVAQTLQRALPDRPVVANLGSHWGPGDHTHAEVDVSFVYQNRIYVISCKNEFVEERIWAHLDRLRAIVAEFGESRVRALLLSTGGLTKQMQDRCRAYEIGYWDGDAFLTSLRASALGRDPDGFLRSTLDRARSGPVAGIR